MGWCSGSEIAIEVYGLIRKYIPKDKREKVAKKIYDIFCYHDADAWCGDSKLEEDAGEIYEDD